MTKSAMSLYVQDKSAKTCDGRSGAWFNPQAKAARLELRAKYGPDVLGLKSPQWQDGAYVNNHKYHGATAHSHLSNSLLPQHLCPSDFRSFSSSTHQPLVKQPAEFTRGDMTTGWNFSTCTCSTMQINDSSSHAAPASQHPYKIKNYCSPVESAAASAASLRTAKQLPALQLQDWTRKHGSEGAAAMQHMQTLKPLKPHKMLKVGKLDMKAVADLDEVPVQTGPSIASQSTTSNAPHLLPGMSVLDLKASSFGMSTKSTERPVPAHSSQAAAAAPAT